MEHTRTSRVDAISDQTRNESLADGDDAIRSSQRPAVELVVEMHLKIRCSVSVLKGKPFPVSVEAREAEQKMRFDVVRLDDIGFESGHQGCKLR